ncbi:MAG: uroporphyrinogen decarboxylase family protein [bacterium]
MSEYKTREKFIAVMCNGDISKGFPVIEWAGWWDLTYNNWIKQGAPTNTDLRSWFGLEEHHQIWYAPNRTGIKNIIDERDYNDILPKLYPEPHFDPNVMEHYRKRQENGDAFLWLTLEGPFWYPRTLFGIERHLFAFYDHPNLMKRINDDLADFNIKVIEEVCKYYIPDFMTFAEDMSYNHGPMISYDMMDEFMKPFYLKVIPKLTKRGIIPMIDSDGDIEPLIPWFEEVGLQGILPLERMAGVDVNRIRKNYPKWRMIGGFDKTVMHLGESAIRREFERIKPAVLAGYYIPSCDHQTPPEVSLEDYKLYVSILVEFSNEVANEAQKIKFTI